LVLERPGAALLQYFAGVETDCLIDALASEEHSGVVRIEPDALLLDKAAISSHRFGVAEALQLAAALQQLPPRLLLYGVVDAPDCLAELSAMLATDLQR
jgi:Ni,Fe-hydrogenase maturation factor